MKKLVVIILIIFAISLCADELEVGTLRHVGCAFIGDSINQIICNNIKFTQNHVSEVTFYTSFTALTVYELWSNDWNGFKFWDYTGSIFGMPYQENCGKAESQLSILNIMERRKPLV